MLSRAASILAVASPSATPGARLNDTVTACNWPDVVDRRGAHGALDRGEGRQRHQRAGA